MACVAKSARAGVGRIAISSHPSDAKASRTMWASAPSAAALSWRMGWALRGESSVGIVLAKERRLLERSRLSSRCKAELREVRQIRYTREVSSRMPAAPNTSARHAFSPRWMRR
ncbi:hypothetical protein BSFA1_45020 [Burkholderia sp. SFA1]|nr:hypothetical protein BSFA1_45020 [Burkholderia sp. SFA1]